MLHLVIASAQAFEVDVGLGSELVANEPFLNPVGMRGSVTLRPLPWLGAGLSLAGYPLRVQTTRHDVIAGFGIVPDVAPIVGTGSFVGTVRFARGPIGTFDGAIDLVVGVGGVYSVDDCVALQMESAPVCLGTQRQLHPASIIGLNALIGQGQWGVRLRGERWAYTETVAGSVEQSKDPVWLGVDLVVRFGGVSATP
jgi:hypothetical protein